MYDSVFAVLPQRRAQRATGTGPSKRSWKAIGSRPADSREIKRESARALDKREEISSARLNAVAAAVAASSIRSVHAA